MFKCPLIRCHCFRFIVVSINIPRALLKEHLSVVHVGLVFVCGSRDGLMTVTGRKHNMDDIIATVLAVEPMKFIYRGRIAVFSVRVLRDERICIVAEQRPDCGEEEVRFIRSKSSPSIPSITRGVIAVDLLKISYANKHYNNK